MNDPYLAFSSNFMDRLIQARTYKDRLAMEERQENRYQQQFDQNLELSKRSLGLREKEFEVNKDLRDQNFLFQKQKDEENRIFRDRQIDISQERADIARQEHENKWGTPEEQEQRKIEESDTVLQEQIATHIKSQKPSRVKPFAKNFTKDDVVNSWVSYRDTLDVDPSELPKIRGLYYNQLNQSGHEWTKVNIDDLPLPEVSESTDEYEFGQIERDPKTGVEYYYAGNNQWATKSEWEKMNK